MKRFAFYLGIAAGLVASCSTQEKDFQTPQQEDVIYYASFEQPGDEGTRVYANEDLLLRWNADDRVSIFGNNTYNQQYKFLGETGDNSGGFSKVDGPEYVTGNPISHTVSVYPYLASTKIAEDEVITVTLPAEQTYAENTFGLGANTMVSVSEDNVLQYKNVGGYLMLKLYGEGVSVSSITLRGNNGEKLAGKATVTMPLDGVPSVSMANDATTEITLLCESPVQLGGTVEQSSEFWFVVPPVTFSRGFTVTAIDSMGGTFEKSTNKTVTINRNNLSKMSPMEVVPDYDNVIISFKDANFKAYCVDHYDKNGDGEVSGDEVKYVISISNLNTDEITSIEEIKYFRSLKYLSVRGSYDYWGDHYEVGGALESLDLRYNPELELFASEGNPLRELNLCYNTKLKTLTCAYGYLTDFIPSPASTNINLEYNQLTRLDITNCSSLESLTVNYNQLTELDPSQFNKLNKLYCSNNKIQILDISNNTLLTRLDCSNNQIQSLDISNNVLLTTVRCNNNQIESLVLGNNDCLGSLQCNNNQISGNLFISTLPSLSSLNCSHNNITALRLEGCSLKSLDCSQNQIESLDIGNQSSTLRSLQCGSNNILHLDCGQFVSLEELKCGGCKQLLSVILPQTVSNFTFSFNGCNSLQTVDLPTNLTSIPASAFESCTSLTELSIPQSVTSIGYYSFAHCTALSTIDIPNSVTSLGDGAFNHTGLTSIIIPDSITSTGNNTFALCDKLSEVILPEGLISLGNQVFLKCYSLESITIPSSVTSIGYNAFVYCSRLSSITIKAIVPPVAEQIFYLSGINHIYVPAESVEAYKTDSFWSNYADLIQAIPSSVPVPEAVDMGLSVKWASFNLGASKPEEYGDYYSWGETDPKDEYSWSTYKWCMGSENTLTKYCINSSFGYNGFTDDKTVLDPEDDAAHVNLGGSWRMPTDAELTELIQNCTWTWTTQNGVDGRLVTGPNGNSIFLPAAGDRNGTNLNGVGSGGNYWSSSLNTVIPNYAWYVYFSSGGVYRDSYGRCYGQSVRPVYAE